MDIKLLSLIVPIYKQESTIKFDLNRINDVLKQTPYNYEIIGVVDGTELDDSFEQAKKVESDHIKIYGYKENKGKGLAVRYGMGKAKGDIITFLDSGMDINPSGIVILLEHMKWYDADIIVGSKLHPASKVKGYPIKRRILTWGYFLGVKFLFGLRVRDTQTGLKAYKRNVIKKVLPRLVVKKFAFDIEVLAVARRLGFTKIYDAPVEIDWRESNTSLSSVVRSGVIKDFVLDTMAIWFRMHILKYYDADKDRVRVYDENLDMYINTGGMLDQSKENIMKAVDKFFALFHVKQDESDEYSKA